jgi:hypothetical protein
LKGAHGQNLSKIKPAEIERLQTSGSFEGSFFRRETCDFDVDASPILRGNGHFSAAIDLFSQDQSITP